MCYIHTKFEVDPMRNTPKIRFLSVLWLGLILTLTFDPLSFDMMITSPLILLYANNNVPYLLKIQFLRYNVTKWRHNVTILVDLESTHQVLSYAVLHYMVLSISKFDLPVSNFRPATRSIKVKADRPQKIISWAANHMLFTYQVWSWSDNIY
jgi:hypothetical protein